MVQPHHLRFFLALAAVVLVQFTPLPALGQQLFRINGWDGQVRASGSFENESLSGGQKLNLQRFFFREEFALRTSGAVVDPRLLSFVLGGQVSLIQDELQSESRGDSITQTGDGLLFGYDGQLALVAGFPYSVDFFASRSETNVRRTFVGRTLGEAERFGATIHARSFPLQSTATFQERRSKQRQRLGTEQLQQDETRRTLTYRGWRRGATSDLVADYRFDDVEDRVRKAGNFKLHLGGLSYVWRPSLELDRALFSNARVFARRGETESTTVTASESMTWQLTRNLWSNSNYGFSLFDTEGSQVTTHRGNAGLRHQWYKSLSTSVHAESTFTEFGEGEELDYGGGVSWSYLKEILWEGRLSASVSGSYLLADRDMPPGLVDIFDEQHTFTDASPVILGNLDVVFSTITVTDESRTVVFSEGIDYSVEQLGRRTEIRRNPFGSIEDGDVVLVSYGFETGGPFRIGSRPISFSGSLDFGWVGIFYSGERLRQDVFEGEEEVTLGSVDSDTAGVEFRWQGERLNLTFANEYRRYRSIELRLQALTFTQTGTWSLSERLRVQLLANEAFHDFSRPDRTREFFTGRGSLQWQPVRSLRARGFAGFRYQKETAIPRETVIEAGTDVRWKIGELLMTLLYEIDRHELGGSTRIGNFVRLETTRSF